MGLFFKFLFISLFFISHSYGKVSESLKVTLSHGGGVIGRYQTSLSGRGIRAFRGIPFAEPPVENLRFHDPIEKVGWAGFISGEKGQVMCPQIALMAKQAYMGDEDCLYLNVYVPQFPETTDPLPVMVFVHGGGFGIGSGSQFQPDYILDHDVILVVGNYRLGPLGFLSTFTEEMYGNYGIKDQVETLKWVQKNIEVFGGDPSKVTIFGESAGGASVSLLLTTPLARGLFQRAIIQSGTLYEPWAVIPKDLAKKKTLDIFSFVGCPFNEANITESICCLRGKSAKEIIDQTINLVKWDIHPLFHFGPVIEPKDSKHPLLNQEIYDFGPDPSIPIIIGINANEGAFIMPTIIRTPDTLKDFQANFNKVLPVLAWYQHFDDNEKAIRTQKLSEFYLQGKSFNWDTDQDALNEIISDTWFFAGFVKFLSKRFFQNQRNTFIYLFNYRGEISFSDLLTNGTEVFDFGVSHADDLFYLSPRAQILFPHRAPTSQDQQFRDIFTKIWVDFASLGHHSPGLNWQAAYQFPVDYMRFGEKRKGFAMGMENGLFPERTEFWKHVSN